jgi:viologen exporter family transport system permease protein
MSQALDPPLPVPGPLAGMRKYVKILRISLVERMVYRADFLVSTVFRFLPLVTTVIFWEAVYASSGRAVIEGYTRNQMIAYLLLVQISRMFSSMPGLAGGIARDIRDGGLKKYLLQPIDMVAYLLAYRVAHKIAYIVTSALPYGILFFLCRDYFDGLPDAVTSLAYIASLLLGFLVGFFFESMIGMVGFWFLEVTSFLYIINTLNFFVSGHMFPLDLLPPFWADVLRALPFQYLAYFPAQIFLGKVSGDALWQGLVLELAWAAVFLVMTRWFYRRGLKRYSAYGG